MAKLTQERILDMAEKIMLEKGMEQTTLYRIAQNLEVSHAALYKHYRNKEDLFQKLALRWLEETSRELFNWVGTPKKSKEENLHDWLWFLAGSKKKSYQTNREMFLLYTDYIEHNQELVKEHLDHLGKRAEEISGWKNQGRAIMTAFVYFHNPYFANRWEQLDYQESFEEVWYLLVSSKETSF
ncbi:TetR family transcriptional regulator [Carnobacterium maltaromaticum]|uniref:TetR family transcriptional regulator n=1 Tax=Carnobacterium maltaromaticum TaxID=2751 RepID=A0AAW9K4L3_CARML|nr:TetR family transcriptional regulator [Carnobacterium maltaromaticum]MDZ5759676.1 TetR family transcriptional regulator [Carnobacterium maltaromaticum]